jgi:hypothetical protein
MLLSLSRLLSPSPLLPPPLPPSSPLLPSPHQPQTFLHSPTVHRAITDSTEEKSLNDYVLSDRFFCAGMIVCGNQRRLYMFEKRGVEEMGAAREGKRGGREGGGGERKRGWVPYNYFIHSLRNYIASLYTLKSTPFISLPLSLLIPHPISPSPLSYPPFPIPIPLPLPSHSLSPLIPLPPLTSSPPIIPAH